MSRIGAKDVLTGKIPEVNYLIVHDKGLADDFAVAINILLVKVGVSSISGLLGHFILDYSNGDERGTCLGD